MSEYYDCEYVREYYGVSAYVGKRISFKGRLGIISEDRGNYIGVNFDDDKPGIVLNVHPTDGVEYLNSGIIRQMTRSQKNYQNYLKSECVETFSEWMGFGKERNFSSGSYSGDHLSY